MQFSFSNNCAIGLQTKFDLPTMTACNPDKDGSVSLISIEAPCGVQGTIPLKPLDK